MTRVTVYHLTLPKRLPLIEADGLQTRATMSSLLGPIDGIDVYAPGVYANGKRVSGWLSEDHARKQVDELGAGRVSYTVDPAKVLAVPASHRQGSLEQYWPAAKPLREWLAEDDIPEDLEVHQNVAVRAKHLSLHAPALTDEQLGDYAPLVHALADDDRLSAKALMHLAVIASAGDFDSTDFMAGCALAWRDEPDPPDLVRELVETDPDKVVSAVLAEQGATAPAALVAKLREVLEETRQWSLDNGMEPGQGIFARTAAVLDELPAHR